MTCDEFTDIVSDYLDGTLPYGERLGAWFHVLLCEHCRRYLEQMRETVELTHELGEQEELEPSGPDEDVKADLVDKFRDAQGNTD